MGITGEASEYAARIAALYRTARQRDYADFDQLARELSRLPLPTVRSIVARLGWSISGQTREAMVNGIRTRLTERLESWERCQF